MPANHDNFIGLTHAHGRLFTPGSVFWRVNRETLVGLGGGRALLLELAHPLIAAGVAEHSQFKKNPLQRLYRTAQVMNHLIFANPKQAQKALRHFQQCHQTVRGVLPHDEGTFRAGMKYSAQNPGLKFWVLATLIDSALLAYERFVAPLSMPEKRAYYLDSQKLAGLFGIPFSFIPDSYDEFEAYMQSMFAGETLQAGETARALLQALLTRRGLRKVAELMYYCGLGMLPKKLRESYGVSWSDHQNHKLEKISALCRRTRGLLPDLICINPRAWLAECQLRNQSPPPASFHTSGNGRPQPHKIPALHEWRSNE